MKSTLKPIKCIKYNYAVDKNVQNYDSQEANIEISQDGECLEIYNVKFVENDKFVLEDSI